MWPLDSPLVMFLELSGCPLKPSASHSVLFKRQAVATILSSRCPVLFLLDSEARGKEGMPEVSIHFKHVPGIVGQ